MVVKISFPTDRSSGQPVDDTRQTFAGLVARYNDNQPVVGVLSTTPSAVLVSGTAGMSYQVADFRAVTSNGAGGCELVANIGATSVAAPTAPASNSRIDVIYVKARLTVRGDGAASAIDTQVAVASGTAALSPVAPSLPSGALELARATVQAGATTTSGSTVVIQQTYPCTALLGEAIPARSVDALPDSRALPVGTRGLVGGRTYEARGASWAVTSLRTFAPVVRSNTYFFASCYAAKKADGFASLAGEVFQSTQAISVGSGGSFEVGRLPDGFEPVTQQQWPGVYKLGFGFKPMTFVIETTGKLMVYLNVDDVISNQGVYVFPPGGEWECKGARS